MTIVVDASALLAFLFSEPGGTDVGSLLPDSVISAVNLAETVSRMLDRGWNEADVNQMLDRLPARLESFDRAAAVETGLLRQATRSRGLSLGDRACLALAIREGARVLTADRAWADLELGLEIEVIR